MRPTDIRDQRTSWKLQIARLNATKSGRLAFRMSSDNVAQVTRVRLLDMYAGLAARTSGALLILELERP